MHKDTDVKLDKKFQNVFRLKTVVALSEIRGTYGTAPCGRIHDGRAYGDGVGAFPGGDGQGLLTRYHPEELPEFVGDIVVVDGDGDGNGLIMRIVAGVVPVSEEGHGGTGIVHDDGAPGAVEDGAHGVVPFAADGYEYKGQPVIISEFGGIAFNNDDSGWGYGGKVNGKDDFLQRFDGVVTAVKELPYACGFCYTQVTDVQQEINGLMDIDRNFKIEPEIIKEINERNVSCLNK